MKKIFSLPHFLFLSLCLAVLIPSWAASGSAAGRKGANDGPGDGAFRVLCQSLPAYSPDPGVEYRPGVDVHGRPVAPADLNAALAADLNEVIRVPVTLDLVRRFNLYPFFGIEMKPDVGSLAIHPDGRVEYNGQDLSRQAYTLCARDTKIVLPSAQ